MNQQFVSTHQVESGFQENRKRYPTQFSGHLTEDLDQHLAELDGTTYKVWSCLNRLLDSRAVNCQGYYLGYTVRVSQANLAERTNLSVSTVKRCLGKLEDAGIITVDRPIFGCNRYRLMGYGKAIEAQINPTVQIDPTIPSGDTIEKFIEQDAQAEFTGEPSIVHNDDPSIAHNDEPHNRPSLRDKSIIDSLSGPEVDEAEKVDEGETGEREGLADRFYQDVLNRPLLSEAKRRAIDGYFREIVTNIAADDRVESPEAAHEVLTDAFGGVKKKVAPIWSHKIMTEDYGEKAIEEAIKAKSVSSLSESSSFPSVEPTREPAPTEPKDSPSKSHNNSAALPAAAELNPTDYDTPQAYVYAYCRASVHQKKLTPQELTKLFRAVKGRITQDEIERMHRVERENVYGRRAA